LVSVVDPPIEALVLDVEPRARAADLPLVEKDGVAAPGIALSISASSNTMLGDFSGAGNRAVDFRIVEHDVGGLFAKLERHWVRPTATVLLQRYAPEVRIQRLIRNQPDRSIREQIPPTLNDRLRFLPGSPATSRTVFWEAFSAAQF
jgi:hypothetical protein